jgi:hypothetical protein
MYGHCVYEQILITAKLQIGQRGQKTELNGRSPLRRGMSALDCSVIEEEKEEEKKKKAPLVSFLTSKA